MNVVGYLNRFSPNTFLLMKSRENPICQGIYDLSPIEK